MSVNVANVTNATVTARDWRRDMLIAGWQNCRIAGREGKSSLSVGSTLRPFLSAIPTSCNPAMSASRCVGDGPHFAVAQIQAPHFLEGERARAAAAEDGDLVAAFVHRAIAVEPFRHRQRRR